jgi:hypothetical protein
MVKCGIVAVEEMRGDIYQNCGYCERIFPGQPDIDSVYLLAFFNEPIALRTS